MLKSERLRVTTITAAALLAVVVVLWGARPAEAVFPGSNGKIAFVSNRLTATNPVPPGQSSPDYEIFTMNPDGTGIEQITFNSNIDFYPAFSADGSKLAWTSYQDGNPEIYVRFFFGGTPVVDRLTTSAGTYEFAPSFSPDGSRLAFDRMPANASDSREIYVMDTTDSDNDGNGDNQTNLSNNTAEDHSPAWSPDGSKIAFVSELGAGSGRSEVLVMDTDPATNDATNLSNNPAYDLDPNWSPDGNKIAFASQLRDISNPNNTDIYLMNAADGSGQKRLTRNAAIDRTPAFSPSGTRIAFMSSRGDGYGEIFTMKPRPESRKNRPKNLTRNDGVNDFRPDWQPVP